MAGANGDIRQIVYTPMTKMIASDEHKILTIYGATGNGKSMYSTLKFLTRIIRSRPTHNTYILAGRDIQTLEKRFIESNHSVFNWYPFKDKWRYYKQNKSGGSQIIVKGKYGDKQIFLTPFNNINTYSRVLGSTIDGFFIDEAVESDELFLQECVSRTIRQEHSWLIQTSNGGDPAHYFYWGVVDKSMTVDDVYENTTNHPVEGSELPRLRSVPYEELRYQSDDRDRYKMFYHLSLEDNPTYTEAQLEAYYREYPKNSYMYFSRILGVRGFTEESPFSSYTTEKNIVRLDYPYIDREEYTQHVFSVDSGGHVFSKKIMPDSMYNDGDFGTNKGGHTVVMNILFNKNYTKGYITGGYFPNDMIQLNNAEKISQYIYMQKTMYPLAQHPYLFNDPADSSMMASLLSRVKNVNTIRPATKRDMSIKMDEPVVISLMQQWFADDKLKIVDNEFNRRWLIPALQQARLDNKGRLIDNEDWHSDIMDALKYIFSSLYRLLITKI